MADIPPVQFAAYPRAGAVQWGSADKLQALADGYFGMNYLFGAGFVYNVAVRFAPVVLGALSIVLIFGGIIALALFSFTFVNKIAFGLNWSTSKANWAKLLMAFNFFCCEIVGILILQSMASREMKNYGLRPSYSGFKKREVYARIAQLRQEEAAPTFAAPPSF
jgi:hypothetical protein